MSRFEIDFFPGEDDERLPEWSVIELIDQTPTTRIGKVVWRTYNMEHGEDLAREMAYIMQHEYNEKFYEEYA